MHMDSRRGLSSLLLFILLMANELSVTVSYALALRLPLKLNFIFLILFYFVSKTIKKELKQVNSRGHRVTYSSRSDFIYLQKNLYYKCKII